MINVPKTSRYQELVRDAERRIVRQSLHDADGVVSEAARRLGVTYRYLHRRLVRLGMCDDESKNSQEK